MTLIRARDLSNSDCNDCTFFCSSALVLFNCDCRDSILACSISLDSSISLRKASCAAFPFKPAAANSFSSVRTFFAFSFSNICIFTRKASSCSCSLASACSSSACNSSTRACSSNMSSARDPNSDSFCLMIINVTMTTIINKIKTKIDVILCYSIYRFKLELV